MNLLLIIVGSVLLLTIYPVGAFAVIAHKDGVKVAFTVVGVASAVCAVVVGGALLISAGMGAL